MTRKHAKSTATAPRHSPPLLTLPVELWPSITTHLPPATLASLSLTCRALHNIIATHGWRTYISTHHPHYTGPALYSSAAHSLSRHSTAWSLRSLNAQYALPLAQGHVGINEILPASTPWTPRKALRHSNAYLPPPNAPRRRAAGQTISYQAQLDATSLFIGPRWADQREILAVGAGAELLIRERDLGDWRGRDAADALEGLTLEDRGNAGGKAGPGPEPQPVLDDHGHRVRWRSFLDHNHREGFDDVTAVRLLPSTSPAAAGDAGLDVLVGRASGELAHLHVPAQPPRGPLPARNMANYDTGAQPMRFLAVEESGARFATGLTDGTIALYDVASTRAVSHARVACKAGKAGPLVWSGAFIGKDKLAVGHGYCSTPLDVFSARPEGLGAEPTRSFALGRKDATNTAAGLIGDGAGNVFVAGHHSGAITVHDMRDRRDVAGVFLDAIEADDACYCVLPVLPHLVLAGTGKHCKVNAFDLRVGKAPPDALPFSSTLYLPALPGAGAPARPAVGAESSVYSLVKAGASVYAGIAGAVVQLDAWSAADPRPDPVFRPLRHGAGAKARAQRERREKRYCGLALVTHGVVADWREGARGEGGGKLPMFAQRPFGEVSAGRRPREEWGLDERWVVKGREF